MKRRNIFQITLGIILLLFALNACQDVLDVVPSDKLSIDRLLNKETQIENFRDNSYNNLNTSFTGQSSGQLLEAYTDDAFRSGTGVTYNWHNALLTPSNSYFAGAIWNSCWEGIRKCNLAIKYIPQSRVSKEQLSEVKLNRWIAEVKVLRAWYHFDLIKNFGPVPFVDEPFGADFDGWNELTRPSYDEIATRIVEECDAVISEGLLPLRWSNNSDFDKINLAVAYALKSRVLLYNASTLNNPGNDQSKWQRAASAAQACVSELSGQYNLLPIANYDQLFSQAENAFNDEVIFRSKVNGAGIMNSQNGVDLNSLGSPTQSANCGAVPTQELVDCFELLDGALPVLAYTNPDHTSATYAAGYNEDPGSNPYVGRDARLQYAIVFNSSTYGKYKGQAQSEPDLVIYTYEGKSGTGFNPNPTSELEAEVRRSCTGYYSKKYRSASYWGSTTGGTNSNKIYFRLAEAYLNLAEANCELNKLDEAITALDMIRERAGQPKISLVPGFEKTKDFLLERIRNERRVELCFEGHRFFDQRRWDVLEETNKVITGMQIVSSDGTDVGEFSYNRVKINVPRSANSDKYLVLPIPQNEARKLTGLGQPEAWQ